MSYKRYFGGFAGHNVDRRLWVENGHPGYVDDDQRFAPHRCVGKFDRPGRSIGPMSYAQSPLVAAEHLRRYG